MRQEYGTNNDFARCGTLEVVGIGLLALYIAIYTCSIYDLLGADLNWTMKGIQCWLTRGQGC